MNSDPKSSSTQSASTQSPSTGSALTGLAVLVVEDEIVIALDAQAMLEDAGARQVDLALKAQEALRLVAAGPPDVAMLDVNLGSGTSFPVADALAARGIPYIFTTGYGSQMSLPLNHSDVLVIAKPYTAEGLVAGLSLALERRNTGQADQTQTS